MDPRGCILWLHPVSNPKPLWLGLLPVLKWRTCNYWKQVGRNLLVLSHSPDSSWFQAVYSRLGQTYFKCSDLYLPFNVMNPNWIHSVFLYRGQTADPFLGCAEMITDCPMLAINKQNHTHMCSIYIYMFFFLIYRYVYIFHVYIYIYWFVYIYVCTYIKCHLTGTFQMVFSHSRKGRCHRKRGPADLEGSGAQGWGQCLLEFVQRFFF